MGFFQKRSFIRILGVLIVQSFKIIWQKARHITSKWDGLKREWLGWVSRVSQSKTEVGSSYWLRLASLEVKTQTFYRTSIQNENHPSGRLPVLCSKLIWTLSLGDSVSEFVRFLQMKLPATSSSKAPVKFRM